MIEKIGADTAENEPFKVWGRKTAVLVRKPDEYNLSGDELNSPQHRYG